nr:hypothetical protein [Tanacetum cinerariifolium]
CSSCGTLYTRDCVCSKGNVEDKILFPKPPKNCARCTRCGYLVDGPNCQGCALLRQELEENMVTYSPDFQNSFEPSNASTNVVNAPREPYVVKQDNGSFVDKIIFRAPDSPDQFHCFHCKDVLRAGEACKRCTCAKCGSGLGKGLCYICGHNQNFLNDSPSISETSSQSPLNINHCCYECGDPLDGIFCKRCTCKSCGKDAHIGYNCPSKVSVISNPEPCNNQTIDALPQTLPIFHPIFYSEAESPFTLDSTPTYVDESSNVFNPPPQPYVYPCEFCRNDAYYGHYCSPQAPFIYPEPISETSSQSPPNINHCCYECGDPLDGIFCKRCTCKSYGKDAHIGYNCPSKVPVISNQEPCNNQTIDELPQALPIFHPTFHSEAESPFTLDSTPTYVNESPNLPVCYDDDDDEERSYSLDDNIISGLPPFSAITPDAPVLSIEEPDNSLSMRDEHLDTIPETESDEFIKSGVENLIPIPSESEGIPEHMCDVPSHDNSPPLDVSKGQIEDFSESNKEFSSIDDDSFSIDNIDYVEASPPDSKLVSSEVMEIAIPEVGGIDDDILLTINHDVLR